MPRCFKHRPLLESTEWIRILHLEPSSLTNSPLRGSLVEARLADHPEYYAISYLWGDVSYPPTCSFLLKSSRPDECASLPIYKSCDTALRHLRWKKKPRPVWIDAVCIDQSNIEERGHQVGIMQFVYKEAKKTVVWLDLKGVAISDCRRVFNLAKLTSRMCQCGLVRLPRARNETLGSWVRHVGNRLTMKCLWNFYDNIEELLLSILDNPYFGRAWTVQELVVTSLHATEIVSYAGNIKWVHLLALVYCTRIAWGVLEDRYERTLRVRRRLACRIAFEGEVKIRKVWCLRLQEPAVRLSDAMASHFSFQNVPYVEASDPKDKAYAFLWALPRARDANLDIFTVDYNKSLETICIEFTVAVAYETGDLLPLFYMACQQHKIPALPSWVPDWTTAPTKQEWYFLRELSRFKNVNSGRKNKARIGTLHLRRIDGGDRALVLDGRDDADRVCHLERVPVLSEVRGGEGNYSLHPRRAVAYSPAEYEKLLAALHRVFQMLDGGGDLARLSRVWGDTETFKIMAKPPEECLLPAGRHMRYQMVFVVARAVVCSYVQAKRSEKPSDVDMQVWAAGVRGELEHLITADRLESSLAAVCHSDGQDSMTEPRGDSHVVTELLVQFLEHCEIVANRAVDCWARGGMGATVFKTQSGKVGVGQADIEIGDEVIWLRDTPCPVVIRRLAVASVLGNPPEGPHCKLISMANVADLTDSDEDLGKDNFVKYVLT